MKLVNFCIITSGYFNNDKLHDLTMRLSAEIQKLKELFSHKEERI